MADLYRDPERFWSNWQVLQSKNYNPLESLTLLEQDGVFDVIIQDYVDYNVWYAPSVKSYRTREQAFAALGRLLDSGASAAKPSAQAER